MTREPAMAHAQSAVPLFPAATHASGASATSRLRRTSDVRAGWRTFQTLARASTVKPEAAKLRTRTPAGAAAIRARRVTLGTSQSSRPLSSHQRLAFKSVDAIAPATLAINRPLSLSRPLWGADAQSCPLQYERRVGRCDDPQAVCHTTRLPIAWQRIPDLEVRGGGAGQASWFGLRSAERRSA